MEALKHFSNVAGDAGRPIISVHIVQFQQFKQRLSAAANPWMLKDGKTSFVPNP